MNKFRPKFIIWFCVPLLLIGCAEQHPSQTIEQICLPVASKAEAMTVSENVLAKMHFEIEKFDTDRGYIRTRPLRAGQFFEFWREDNPGAFNWSEANIHSIRRIAELEISRQEQQICVGCEVMTERLDMPERRIRSRARPYSIFSPSSSSIQRLQLGTRRATWDDLGKDTRLATLILQRIEKNVRKIDQR